MNIEQTSNSETDKYIWGIYSVNISDYIPKEILNEIEERKSIENISFKIIWLSSINWILKYKLTLLTGKFPTINLSKEELEELLKQTQPIERVKAETNEKTSDTLQQQNQKKG